MFGEFDSESPRVPSPWDSLTPPSSPQKLSEIPKLVPEADEGNVEYKLQLLSPTPARFARLVTQLKWRLLEGGGQAYYEIGVADSGTLVGLPRDQLEQSLETLEMMAGEIGASVIVVKEIKVSLELSSPTQSQIERWDERSSSSSRRKDLLRMKGEGSPATSATELETELSNTDVTDNEETDISSPATSPASTGGGFNFNQPFDPALVVFTMDVGEDVYDNNEAPDDDIRAEYTARWSTALEIFSVYKPRPMKKRAMHTLPQSTHQEFAKGRFKNGYPPSKSVEGSVISDPAEPQPEARGSKAQLRRNKRDKRRELKLITQLPHTPTLCSNNGSPTNPIDLNSISSCSRDECGDPALESAQIAVVGSPAGGESGTTTAIAEEPRLIVEALVVRKLSLEEVFLDFGGFTASGF